MRIDEKNLHAFTPEQLAAMVAKMKETSLAFYRAAAAIGNHAFIEFAGLMNEYIKACEAALDEGIDFTQCNTHSRHPLPIEPFHAKYIGEKLGCIYGPSLASNPKSRELFLAQLGIGPQCP